MQTFSPSDHCVSFYDSGGRTPAGFWLNFSSTDRKLDACLAAEGNLILDMFDLQTGALQSSHWWFSPSWPGLNFWPLCNQLETSDVGKSSSACFLRPGLVFILPPCSFRFTDIPPQSGFISTAELRLHFAPLLPHRLLAAPGSSSSSEGAVAVAAAPLQPDSGIYLDEKWKRKKTRNVAVMIWLSGNSFQCVGC